MQFLSIYLTDHIPYIQFHVYRVSNNLQTASFAHVLLGRQIFFIDEIGFASTPFAKQTSCQANCRPGNLHTPTHTHTYKYICVWQSFFIRHAALLFFIVKFCLERVGHDAGIYPCLVRDIGYPWTDTSGNTYTYTTLLHL